MKEKAPIVVRVPVIRIRGNKTRLTGVVRISAEAELAIRKIAASTRLPMSWVASQLIEQAADVCVCEEVAINV